MIARACGGSRSIPVVELSYHIEVLGGYVHPSVPYLSLEVSGVFRVVAKLCGVCEESFLVDRYSSLSLAMSAVAGLNDELV